MQSYELVITDITQYSSLYCIAGWDLQHGGMIRLEPSTADTTNEAARFWENMWVGPDKPFRVGNVVHFDAIMPVRSNFLHATEDRILNEERRHLRVIGRMTQAEIIQTVSARACTSLH